MQEGTKELSLESGRDYPNTYREFVKMFLDDTAGAAYLAQLRWPEGFICPASFSKAS